MKLKIDEGAAWKV